MRITNSMLWHNSRLGSAMLGSSLLGSIGGSRTSQKAGRAGNSYDFLNTYTSKVNSYAKLGSSSEGLRSAAAAFASTNSSNIFTSARETESVDGLLDQAKNMVNGYNDTMKNLKGQTSSLNNVYGDMLQNAFNENRDALGDIGITVDKDGTVSLDGKKFQNAGVDAVEKALGALRSGSRLYRGI